ncbi:MAG: prepilin peptidase [Alphaproteobacteria bacterium]|nr:prepilin peptidase [Alphaproteobacteria bacterium]
MIDALTLQRAGWRRPEALWVAGFGFVGFWAAIELEGLRFWAGWSLGGALLALAIADIRRHILPDRLTLPLIPAGLIVTWAGAPSGDAAALTLDHAIGAAAGFALFATIGAAYWRLRGREGLGLGDAKLLGAGGAWIGWQALPDLVLLASLTALAGTGLAACAGRPVGAATQLPFGAFLAAAFWLIWLYDPLAGG